MTLWLIIIQDLYRVNTSMIEKVLKMVGDIVLEVFFFP
jgi:hypothetical protein